MSSKNKDKKPARPSTEQVSLRTRLSKETRQIIAECPAQELRPVRFTSWVKRLIPACRRDGLEDQEIMDIIRMAAKSNHWAADQVDATLSDYGLQSLTSAASVGSSVGFGIRMVTRLMYAMTGLDELALLKAETRDELEKQTRTHRLEYVVPLSEYEINHHIGEISKAATILSIWIESLRDRKIALKHNDHGR